MRRNLKLISAALLFPMAMTAQTANKIQGTIIAESDGQPIPGVVVRVKGTASGTVTDIDGHYQLSVNPKDVVEFSCIGYKTVTHKGDGTYDFKMEDDTNMLDEVVAIGYGSMKKSDLTGSVSVVKAEDLKKTPAASVDQAIQGRVAGVTVNANSGQPGAGAVVRIRGIGTVNDSSPIYVVDGNITSDISFLSPNDIESTEVLKDASSTAIYGSRGANGVILITTKSGEKGRGKVSFDMYYGWQSRWKKLDLMGKDEFVDTYIKLNASKTERAYYEKFGFNEWLQQYKLGKDAYYAVAKTKKYENGLDYSAIDTDWQDEVFNNNAPIQNYHVSFDGGSDKSNYSFSASYFDQDGTIMGSNYDRLTLHANTSFQVKPWLKVGENLSFVTSKSRNGFMEQNASPGASVISAALAMAPWDMPYYPQGTFNRNNQDMSGKFGVPSNFKNVTNPFSMVYNSHPRNVTNRWFGNLYLEFTPIKGMIFRTNFSYDQVNEKNRSFTDAHTVNDYDDTKGKNFLTRGLVQYTTFTWENILTYMFDVKKIHHFNLMAGQTTEEYNYYSIGNSGASILNPAEKNWYLSNTTEDNTNPASDGVARTRRLSFLARVNYNLLDRYLFTFNFRADGSNKFPENTWGYFPSTALAWKVSEEPFMKKFKHLDYLKLRLGWGQIGNDKIGNDAFQQNITSNQNVFVGYPFGVNQSIPVGATILKYANQGGKWERTETWNVGVDAAWGNGLLSATADFFVRNTKDMLLTVKGPAWAGNRYDPQSNVGTVRNTGVELTLGHAYHVGKFNYSVNGNVSFIKNKLTKLNGGQKIYGDRVLSDEGLPLFEFWGYKYEGVYKSKEEADAALPGYARDGETNPYGAGDAIYADIDGDGKITEDGDRVKLGNNFPKVSYGLNLSADYKGIDLQLFFQGVAGNKIYNALRERTESNGLTSQLSTAMRDVWTEDNPNGTIPNPKGANNKLNSSRFLESGSYFRLKNVQLGYTFPKKLLNAWGISNLRVYAQASNLFTITDYTGYDPEVGSGVDYGNYPQSRSFLLGCNFTF